MARSHFGGTSVDWLLRPYSFGGTTLLALRTGTTVLDFYSAETGGAHYIDLLDENGSAVSSISVTDHQVPDFEGPDGILAMWADKGDGSPREKMEAQDLAAAAAAVADAEAARDAILAVVINVKSYGAVGNWSTGTTGTDDTTAIGAAFTAAAAAVAAGAASARVMFPWTTGNGYKITAGITVPAGVELDMRSPIVYCGAGGATALTIGSGTAESRRMHRIMLKRYTVSDWTTESDAGLVIRNHYSSEFHVVQCDAFTVGVTLIGDTSNGFSYNKVYFGTLEDNKIAVDLTNDTSGWCNENSFYGGRFTVQSATYTSLDRVGVRVTSRAGTKYYNNSNKFYAPSFELKGAAIAGNSTCLLVEYGRFNSVHKARHESNSPEVLSQQNDSTDSWVDFAFSDEGSGAPVAVLTGTSVSGGVTRDARSMIERAQRVIYKADNLHQKACYYDGATSINVPGLTVGTSGTSNTDARAASSLVLNASYIEVPSSRYVGFYMSTRELKRFAVLREAESGFGGRVMVRAYDSGGSILSAAGTVQTSTPSNNPIYATSYGGAWRTGGDSNDPYSVGVSATTDYVFIGVTGGTAAARLRALSVSTVETTNPATWLAFPDNGRNYGTAAPTAGTWTVGREVINDSPGATGSLSWVCVTAGTPGTWRATGGGVAPQVDAITATGTWTKPSGAKTHQVVLVSGGGGGGSGRRGAAGTVRCGGGGGGGGGVTIVELDAADVPSSHTVTIGAGGAGGAAVTANDTSGNAGSLGTATHFGSIASAYPGSTAAAGGTAAAGAGGTAGTGISNGGAGGAASATGAVGGNGVTGQGGGGGGGSGGGITTGDAASNGGIGLISRMMPGSNASGGVVDSTAPQSGTAPTAKGIPSLGGGGGASSITTVAQTGATPNGYGGGGGGGGASLNGNNSGAGATGAAGYALVITYF